MNDQKRLHLGFPQKRGGPFHITDHSQGDFQRPSGHIHLKVECLVEDSQDPVSAGLIAGKGISSEEIGMDRFQAYLSGRFQE